MKEMGVLYYHYERAQNRNCVTVGQAEIKEKLVALKFCVI
jgi:hypothetical protein